MAMHFTFETKLWLYSGKGAWVFATVPKEISEDIAALVGPNRNGFGSVKVEVAIDGVKWLTSVFPDSKQGTFFLPIKKQVRQQAQIDVGDTVGISITPQL